MKFLSVFILTAFAFALTAAEDNVHKLPDGRELVNPYILDRTPADITVGHRDGAMKLEIRKLPADMQKKLSYDEKKAQEYEGNRKTREENQLKRAKLVAAEQEKEMSQAQLNQAKALNATLQAQINDLEDRLAKQKTEVRISQDFSPYGFFVPGLQFSEIVILGSITDLLNFVEKRMF